MRFGRDEDLEREVASLGRWGAFVWTPLGVAAFFGLVAFLRYAWQFDHPASLALWHAAPFALLALALSVGTQPLPVTVNSDDVIRLEKRIDGAEDAA